MPEWKPEILRHLARLKVATTSEKDRVRHAVMPEVSAIVIGIALVGLSVVAPVQAVAQQIWPAESQIGSKGNSERSSPLLKVGADLPQSKRSSSNEAGSSSLARALHRAAQRGNVSRMQQLVTAGANLNGALPGDGTALIGAARERQTAAVRWLLNHGADPNVPARGDGSPLIVAARQGETEIVKLLLDYHADPNMSVRGDGSPLIMAAREGHTTSVMVLLNRGASVNQVVPDDENALIQASFRGQLNVVRLLIARGADINARVWVRGTRNTKGEWRTPLSMALKGRRSKVIAYLLSIGARE